MGASAIGVPGWPEFAFWTASIDSVRIVSMLSLSRACLSVAADVMSLPLGFDLSSIPLACGERMFLLSEETGADHTCVRPALRQRDLQPFEAGRQRACARFLDRRVKEQVRCRRPETAADDDVLG